jgi:hypothetical protein
MIAGVGHQPWVVKLTDLKNARSNTAEKRLRMRQPYL